MYIYLEIVASSGLTPIMPGVNGHSTYRIIMNCWNVIPTDIREETSGARRSKMRCYVRNTYYTDYIKIKI